MSKYGEPWKLQPDGWTVRSSSIDNYGRGLKVAVTMLDGTVEQQVGNADRIVACVNALAGLNPEKLAEFVEAAKALRAIVDACEVRVERFDRALEALEDGSDNG